jgi:hypothetical protein
MKRITQLLSCLLIASVALINSGAAWSESQPDRNLAKPSTHATQKKAKKSTPEKTM